MSNLPFGAGRNAGPEEAQGTCVGTTQGEPSPLAALEGAVLTRDDEDMANATEAGSSGPGAAGPAGKPSTAGPAGPAGKLSIAGPAGAAGLGGPAGPAGPAGAAAKPSSGGAAGTAGELGVAGEAGEASAVGKADNREPGEANAAEQTEGRQSCAVALHYGNPGTEERALARGAAFTDMSDREIVQLTGADRLKLLESLTSQRVEDLAPGQTRELLLLSPQGHIENQALVAETGESTWLLCDAGYGQAFADFLMRMRFMMQVEAVVRHDLGAIGMYAKPGESPFGAFGAFAIAGDGAEPTLTADGESASGPGQSASGCTVSGEPESGQSELGRSELGQPELGQSELGQPELGQPGSGQSASSLPIWADPWPGLEPGGALYGPEPERHPARFRRLHIAAGPRKSLLAVARGLIEKGIRPAGSLAAEALRVVSWRPRMASEGAAPKAIAHELDWLRTAVHLDKGCYRGQETIAKVVNLGRPPRRLAMLYLEGAYGELPEPGASVEWNGRVAGTVTSAVRSVDDGPVVLALLRRAVPGDAVLDLGEYRAGQRAIVNLEGKSSVSPSVMPGAELRGRNSRKLPAGRGLAGTELGGRE